MIVQQDDWYEGHFIPKGTICIANQWSMNKDPAVYVSYPASE